MVKKVFYLKTVLPLWTQSCHTGHPFKRLLHTGRYYTSRLTSTALERPLAVVGCRFSGLIPSSIDTKHFKNDILISVAWHSAIEVLSREKYKAEIIYA